MSELELIASATHVRGLKGSISNRAIALADHVLWFYDQTPITAEVLDAVIPQKCEKMQEWMSESAMNIHTFGEYKGEFYMGQLQLSTLGHLRRLCDALGIETKERRQ